MVYTSVERSREAIDPVHESLAMDHKKNKRANRGFIHPVQKSFNVVYKVLCNLWSFGLNCAVFGTVH